MDDNLLHDVVAAARKAGADAAEAVFAERQSLSVSVRLGELEDQWLTTARDYVREHPLSAVAIGVLAGMLIGRLGRSD